MTDNENSNIPENTENNSSENGETNENGVVAENNENSESSAAAENSDSSAYTDNTASDGGQQTAEDVPPQVSNYQAPEQPGYSYTWNGTGRVRKKNKKAKKLVALVIAITLVLASLAFAAGALSARHGNEQTSSVAGGTDTGESDGDTVSKDVPQVIAPTVSSGNYSSELTTLYEKCSPSCATIYVTSRSGYAIGSGFVVSKDGYVVTNHHVISGGTKVEVIFYNDERYTAEVVGSDSLSDIAVLKIDAGKDLTPIEIGDSDSLKIGDEVVAIGTPYSLNLAGTMTTGVISGVNRSIDVTNDYGTKTKTMTLIQTDSSINPGNSGGPLINMNGQVVGINSLKLMDDYEGIGFAIPITSALDIINELIAYGEVTDIPGSLVTATPKLNISITSVSVARQQYGLSDSVPDGCLVLAVSRSSSIYQAGLELYDVITEFNGTTITGNESLATELAKCHAGQTVTIKVYRANRDGSSETITLTFALDAAE